ncbi:hypothetical protein NCS52_01480400 [Fusarium sp. LHS14.1]|nr:hypothetical protein NCS52_01480400 [Fusarium sp. LHS14.1]
MPLPSTGQMEISSLDVVSFTLLNPQYDVHQPVFIDPANPETSLSHAQSVSLIRRLIAGLKSAGLKPGDVVCIHSFNTIFVPVICLAVIGAGGIFVGTNPSYMEHELTNVLRVSKVKFVLSEPEVVGPIKLAMTAQGLDVDQYLFAFDHLQNHGAPHGMRSWKWLLSQGEQVWIRFDNEQRQTDTVAGYFLTSGTTGLPKVAMVTHRNLVAQHQMFWEKNPRDYKIRTVHVFPLYHIGSFPTVIVSQLRDGREAYIMRRFVLEPWLSYHQRFDITEVFMAPPMVVQVVMSKMADPGASEYKHSLRSVRNGYIGAAPLSADMQKRFHSLLAPSARLGQIWGMTETTSQATSVPPELADLTLKGKADAWGSIGKPLPNVEIKLVDEEGNDTSATRRGEACIKGPNVFRGYLDNEEANRQSWDNEGYFKTGDVMEVDKETGLMYVVDRHKELIKVRGFQVAPAELEGVLTSHPDITDAAVVGIPSERSGEIPRAYVVLRGGASLGPDDIRAFMKSRLASYKALEGGIIFAKKIPKLPSGKILKRVIREWAKEELKGPNAKL